MKTRKAKKLDGRTRAGRVLAQQRARAAYARKVLAQKRAKAKRQLREVQQSAQYLQGRRLTQAEATAVVVAEGGAPQITEEATITLDLGKMVPTRMPDTGTVMFTNYSPPSAWGAYTREVARGLGVLLLGVILASCGLGATEALPSDATPLHASKPVGFCVPSLAVGTLPVRGCWLFAKYGQPDCEGYPTWHVAPRRAMSFWTLHPLTSIPGPSAPVMNPGVAAGRFDVTTQGPDGSVTKTFEIAELGGACTEVW